MKRKLMATLLLALWLTTVQIKQAEAFVPVLILPALVGASLVTIGAIAYYKPKAPPTGWPGHAVLTDAGNVGRVAIGAHAAYSKYQTQEIYGNYLAMKAHIGNIYDVLKASPQKQTEYAGTWSYLTKSGAKTMTWQQGPGIIPGDLVNFPGLGVHKVLSKNGPVYCGAPQVSEQVNATIWRYSGAAGSGGCAGQSAGTFNIGFESAVSPAPTIPKTIPEIKEGNPTGVLPTGVVDELDRMIAENYNGYGVSIIDAPAPGNIDDSPVFVPPDVWNPPSTDTAPTYAPSTSTTIAGNLAGAQANAGTKADILRDAVSARDNYKAGNPLATPANDPVLRGLEDAVTKATAEYNAATGQAAAAEAAAKETYSNAPMDELHNIDWSPFNSLKGAAANVWPFTLLPAVSGVYSELTADPHPPVFDLPIAGQTMHVDLKVFDPVATICRYIFAVTISGGCVFYVVRFWRGVS